MRYPSQLLFLLFVAAPLPAQQLPAQPPPAAGDSPAAAVDPRIPSLTEKELATLKKGQVVVRGEMYTTDDGKRAGKGVAFVVIDKPPEAAFAVLQDYGKIAEYMPRVTKVTIPEKSPTRMKVVQELKVLFKTVVYTLILDFNAQKKRMDWKLDKTAENDIKDTWGFWEFVPYDNGKTLVVYNIAANTGVSIPQFLEDYLTKKDLPEVLMAMKRRTESGGTWKKSE
jgi:ribosome-associated toxin RatA of RatAB toxin-antitoxin module